MEDESLVITIEGDLARQVRTYAAALGWSVEFYVQQALGAYRAARIELGLDEL